MEKILRIEIAIDGFVAEEGQDTPELAGHHDRYQSVENRAVQYASRIEWLKRLGPDVPLETEEAPVAREMVLVDRTKESVDNNVEDAATENAEDAMEMTLVHRTKERVDARADAAAVVDEDDARDIEEDAMKMDN